jgi:hypothetical protein
MAEKCAEVPTEMMAKIAELSGEMGDEIAAIHAGMCDLNTAKAKGIELRWGSCAAR